MSSLDQQLREILEDWYPGTMYEDVIPKIKKLYADEIGKMLEVQGVNGTWNYDSYMHGMYNGMEFCHSIIKGTEPKYREAPDKWLVDIELPEKASGIE